MRAATATATSARRRPTSEEGVTDGLWRRWLLLRPVGCDSCKPATGGDRPARTRDVVTDGRRFCNGDESFLSRSTKLNPPDKKPAISSIPQSQFQGKVKDFLGVISEANNNLELDAKTNPGKNHDIEALTREESEYIEMDLMLGVAELQTEEAVAAAESALAGLSPPLGFYILDTLICSHRTSGLTRANDFFSSAMDVGSGLELALPENLSVVVVRRRKVRRRL
nr:glutamic acid-rich protein [Ipomoea batatas]